MSPLAQLIIAEAPGIIAALQAAFRARNPGAPTPSSEEVIAEFHRVYADSQARDEMLKAALRAEIAAGGG